MNPCGKWSGLRVDVDPPPEEGWRPDLKASAPGTASRDGGTARAFRA
jgi:hypothetical protein